MDETIINGVRVIKDRNTTHFIPVEDPKKITIDNRSWFEKLCDWFKQSKVKPYVKVRDLADPFGDRDDPDKGSDGKSAAEIGVKITF